MGSCGSSQEEKAPDAPRRLTSLRQQGRDPASFAAVRQDGTFVEKWGGSFAELTADVQRCLDPDRDCAAEAARFRRHARFLAEQVSFAAESAAVDPPHPEPWLETADHLLTAAGRLLQHPASGPRNLAGALLLLEGCDGLFGVVSVLLNNSLQLPAYQGTSLKMLQARWRERLRRVERVLVPWRAPTSEHQMLLNSVRFSVEGIADKTAFTRLLAGLLAVVTALAPPDSDPTGAMGALG
eukprot:Hpha_TRINITY_DN23943_c0_g1::TRINITY_DN23943_c0_g1_i1::g.137698::m.137698